MCCKHELESAGGREREIKGASERGTEQGKRGIILVKEFVENGVVVLWWGAPDSSGPGKGSGVEWSGVEWSGVECKSIGV